MTLPAESESIDALVAELEALGGGDARIGLSTVVCISRPCTRGAVRIVETVTGGDVASVHDPRCPDDVPEQQAIRRFPVTRGGAIDGGDANAPTVLFQTVGTSVLEWLLAGFSSAIIAAGEAGSGKTHALFGPDDAVDGDERHGVCRRLLFELYGLVEAKRRDKDGLSPLSIGVACWEVRESEAIDLLAATPRSGPPGRPPAHAGASADPHPWTLVHAPSIAHAMRLLALGRSRSISSPLRGTAGVAGRASLFVRLALHDAHRGSFASLYLVDLVGSSPLPSSADADAAAFAARQGGTPGGGPSAVRSGAAANSSAGVPLSGAALIAERRGLNRQVLSFHQILAEISAADGPVDGGGPIHLRHLPSSRNSPLAQQLTPLLLGSCRCQLLACVRSEAEHFQETCTTLRALTRFAGCRSACMRLLGVELSDVGMRAAESVLPPLHALPRRPPPMRPPQPLARRADAAAALDDGAAHRSQSEGTRLVPPSTSDLHRVWQAHARSDQLAAMEGEAACTAAGAAIHMAAHPSEPSPSTTAYRPSRLAAVPSPSGLVSDCERDASIRRGGVAASDSQQVDGSAGTLMNAFWEAADAATRPLGARKPSAPRRGSEAAAHVLADTSSSSEALRVQLQEMMAPAANRRSRLVAAQNSDPPTA